jgi:hypothetical protein
VKGRTAGIAFAVVCLVLAFLLIFSDVEIIPAMLIFAGVLVLLGLLSRGFRRT